MWQKYHDLYKRMTGNIAPQTISVTRHPQGFCVQTPHSSRMTQWRSLFACTRWPSYGCSRRLRPLEAMHLLKQGKESAHRIGNNLGQTETPLVRLLHAKGIMRRFLSILVGYSRSFNLLNCDIEKRVSTPMQIKYSVTS